MSFKPSGHLEKFGWRKGSGIGKSENGIKEAIKVKLKFDNSGVGHNLGEQFTYHWWEKAYNDASQTVDVKEDHNGIQLQKTGDYVVSTKKNTKSLNKKNLLYGSFIKAATLADGTEHREGKASTDESDSDSNDSHRVGRVLSDEDLLRVCGGRTAHKGARHGLKANGKLARIALQDANQGHKETKFKDEITVDTIDTETTSEKLKKSKKKKKKSKSKDRHESESLEIVKHSQSDGQSEALIDYLDKNRTQERLAVRESCEDGEYGESEDSKKSKKKRKRCKEAVEDSNSIQKSSKINDILESSEKRKKKKNKR